MNPAEENARILLAEIAQALARGTKHYDLQGRLLETPKAIITALQRDGEIVFEPDGTR